MNPMIKGTLDGVLGNSFAAPQISGPVHGDMRGKDWGGNPVSGEPVHGGWNDPFGGGFKQEIPNVGPIGTYKPDPGFDVAMEDWRKPYVKKWQKHHNPSDPFFIKDKEYLKNLQDLVLFGRPI